VYERVMPVTQMDSHGGEVISPFLVIFTDLDGTLLDENTYSWEDAKPALTRCKTLGIPIVIVTSKTRAELEELRKELLLFDPFITENGGAIFFPKEKFSSPPPGTDSVDNLWRLSLGVPYETLKRALREIENEVQVRLKGFSDMDILEIAACSGLDKARASLAARREYDEPFLVDPIDNDRREVLFQAALKRGLKISKGGRFYHLHGRSDKGIATSHLIAWYKEVVGEVYCVGVGDSPNDLPFLKIMDRAIFVGDPALLKDSREQMKNLVVTQMKGPKGWNQGVMDLIKSQGGTN